MLWPGPIGRANQTATTLLMAVQPPTNIPATAILVGVSDGATDFEKKSQTPRRFRACDSLPIRPSSSRDVFYGFACRVHYGTCRPSSVPQPRRNPARPGHLGRRPHPLWLPSPRLWQRPGPHLQQSWQHLWLHLRHRCRCHAHFLGLCSRQYHHGQRRRAPGLHDRQLHDHHRRLRRHHRDHRLRSHRRLLSKSLSSHLEFCATSVRWGGRPDDSQIYLSALRWEQSIIPGIIWPARWQKMCT